MAIDTFIAYVGVYSNPADANADYELVKDLHTKEGLIDAYDAAVIERRADGKVKITKKRKPIAKLDETRFVYASYILLHVVVPCGC